MEEIRSKEVESSKDKISFPIEKVIKILEIESKNWKCSVVTLIALNSKDPFKVLISTIISLRTKDEVTIESSKRLFNVLKSSKDIFNLSQSQIEELIYPCGFYKRKAFQIKEICEIIANDYGGIMPKDIEILLKFKGVGRKTANLVLAQGYNIPAICVDVHVHRISNRLGFIKTKNPEKTERSLAKKLDKKYWIDYNSLLVAFGQSICKPVSPYCSKCPVFNYCKRISVEKYR